MILFIFGKGCTNFYIKIVMKVPEHFIKHILDYAKSLKMQ